MTIKTFDANRVGGGTFQLEQDPLTGEFKVKEVGFVKLPELKLPEIDQAAPVVPDPTPDDPTDDPADPGTGGGSSGGGGGSQQDFTGESMYKNIQKQATTFAGQDTGIVPTTSRDRTNINEGAIQVEGLKEKEAYDKAVANYNAIAERNRDLAMGKQTLSEEQRLENKADIAAARNEMDSARKNYEGTFETIKAAPEIADFSQGPRTVPTGTLTGAKVEDIGEPLRKSTFDADTFDDAVGTSVTAKKNILEVAKQKAKQIIDPSNLGAVKVAETAGKIITGILSGGREPTATQKLNTSLFKTRGDLGSNVDPGRIVGNPATDLYAGFNRTSAYGNLEKAGDKRLETRQKTIERKGYKPGDKFYDDTEKMKDQASKYKAAKQKATQGPAGSDGGGKTDSGKIVCTMMNESYGFGSFRNKIWMKFHGNISPEYQKGYHKLFLPLVSYAKQKGITNKIIKNILEHIAVHSTIDMRQALRGKTHLLGRIYRKVILPLCYWAGRK
tara:strand:- start:522 stop:2021 length:1500 start_codon:yes stop_codon:yes gene_type:complete